MSCSLRYKTQIKDDRSPWYDEPHQTTVSHVLSLIRKVDRRTLELQVICRCNRMIIHDHNIVQSLTFEKDEVIEHHEHHIMRSIDGWLVSPIGMVVSRATGSHTSVIGWSMLRTAAVTLWRCPLKVQSNLLFTKSWTMKS